MSKKILLKDSSRKEMLEAINLLVDAVCSTLGPSGKTVIIHNAGEEPIITKDGVTVAESINLSDPVKNAAIQLVRTVASKMDMESGDGTTTVSVICRELIKLIFELQEQKQDYSAHQMNLEIQQELLLAIKFINRRKRKIKISDIQKIASTSANNDNQIGDLFLKAFTHTKGEGHINIVESRNGSSYVDIIEGFVVDMGYINSSFANNKLTKFFEAEKSYVLLYDNDLVEKDMMVKILTFFRNKALRLPLLIIAKDFSKDTISVAEFNNMDRAGQKICLIKNQLRNDEYRALMEDIEGYTGAQICKKFDEFSYEPGIVENLVVKQGYTIFNGVSPTQKEIFENYISDLGIAARQETSSARQKFINDRITKMKKGITTIYIGADSDIELREKMDRVKDAYNACRGAYESGIIIGGGQSLVLFAKEQMEKRELTDYQTIFYNAIQKPFEQILINSNHNESEIEVRKKNLKMDFGYNAKIRKSENLYKSGIVDPAKIVANGIIFAVSIAMTVASTECLIVEQN